MLANLNLQSCLWPEPTGVTAGRRRSRRALFLNGWLKVSSTYRRYADRNLVLCPHSNTHLSPKNMPLIARAYAWYSRRFTNIPDINYAYNAYLVRPIEISSRPFPDMLEAKAICHKEPLNKGLALKNNVSRKYNIGISFLLRSPLLHCCGGIGWPHWSLSVMTDAPIKMVKRPQGRICAAPCAGVREIYGGAHSGPQTVAQPALRVRARQTDRVLDPKTRTNSA